MITKEFELKPDLFINADNYLALIKIYEKAVKRKSRRFPFRNKEGKLYSIETEYVTFALKHIKESDPDKLDEKSAEYKILEQKLTKEELEKEEFEREQMKMIESEDDNEDNGEDIFTFNSKDNVKLK